MEKKILSQEVKASLRKRLKEKGKKLLEETIWMKKRFKEESIMGCKTHIGDTINGDQAVDISRLTNIKKQIRKIEKALIRLENDEYGFCIKCHHPIPVGRLQLIPFAMHCASCKELLTPESEHRPKRVFPERVRAFA